MARKASYLEPVDHRRRHLGRANRQLVDRGPGSRKCDRRNHSAFLERAIRLALDVYGCRCSLHRFLYKRNVHFADKFNGKAGYGVSGILFNIVITGTINLVFTLLALGSVDRFGRRALMLGGCAGIAVSETVLGFVYRAEIKGLPVLIITLC